MSHQAPPPFAVFRFEISPAQAEAASWYIQPSIERILLMHYMRADFFCKVVESGSLHFSPSIRSSMDTEDSLLPIEGRDKPIILEPLGKYPTVTVDHNERDLGHNLIDRPYTYQHCWTRSIQEDLWMWIVYGHAGEGVCILSDSFSLKEAVIPDSKVELNIVGVPYWKRGNDIPRFIPSVGSAVKKSQGFEAENEVRIVATICPNCRPPIPPPQLSIAVDPAKMINGLVLGPRMTQESAQKVRKALSARFPQITPVASQIEL